MRKAGVAMMVANRLLHVGAAEKKRRGALKALASIPPRALSRKAE